VGTTVAVVAVALVAVGSPQDAARERDRDGRVTASGAPSVAPSTLGRTSTPTPASGAGAREPSLIGTTGFDGNGSTPLLRVEALPCGEVFCARVTRAGGPAGWERVADFGFVDPAEGRRHDLPPVELVRVADDPQHAWAFGQQLWSTHDGGRAWVRQQLPGADPRARVAVEPLGDAVFALQDDPVRVWRSAAGADTWTKLRLPADHRFADAFTSVDDTVVLRAVDGRSNDPELLLGDDSGTTWRTVPVPCQGAAAPIRSTGTALLTACAAGPTDGHSAPSTVWRSPDGADWSVLAGVEHTSVLQDVVAVDDDTALVVTGEGTFLVTSTGQRRVRPTSDSRTSVLDGRFVDPSHGYLLVEDPRRLLATEDGGLTWSQVG
jgi:photosystem II stability/assembly factor-like uncharacterized protein